MAKRRGPVAKIIEAGYGMPVGGGVMRFRVGAQPDASDPKDWDEMLEYIAMIDYNDFNGPVIATFLGFHATAGYFSLVEFGREHSPVLYLHFDIMADKRTPVGKLADGNQKALDLYLESLKIEYGIAPQEASWDAARHCLRLWWD